MVDRHDSREGNDTHRQSGDLFRLMDDGDREWPIGNIVDSISSVLREIQMRQNCHFFRADPAFGEGVATSLGIDLSALPVASNGAAIHA